MRTPSRSLDSSHTLGMHASGLGGLRQGIERCGMHWGRSSAPCHPRFAPRGPTAPRMRRMSATEAALRIHQRRPPPLDGTRAPAKEQRRRARLAALRRRRLSLPGDHRHVRVHDLPRERLLDPAIVALDAITPTTVVAQAGLQQQLISGLRHGRSSSPSRARARPSDGTGRRKRMLAVFALITIAVMFAMFFVQPQAEFSSMARSSSRDRYVFSSLAGVNYNAMLSQVATERNVGRVSGTGWGMGYLASIGLLLIALVLFIQDFGADGGGPFGVPDDRPAAPRRALHGAARGGVVPRLPRPHPPPRARSRAAATTCRASGSGNRIASSPARPALAQRPAAAAVPARERGVPRRPRGGVLVGAVLAAQVYGFSGSEVIYFAVAANLVAGLGTLASGYLDDRFGPKPVIIGALLGLHRRGHRAHGHRRLEAHLWVLGLALCAFVGPGRPHRAAYLARAPPPRPRGRSGLYATTGRRRLAPRMLYFAFITMPHAPEGGRVGHHPRVRHRPRAAPAGARHAEAGAADARHLSAPTRGGDDVRRCRG